MKEGLTFMISGRSLERAEKKRAEYKPTLGNE